MPAPRVAIVGKFIDSSPLLVRMILIIAVLLAIFWVAGARADHNGPAHRDSWTIAGVCDAPEYMRTIMNEPTRAGRRMGFMASVATGLCRDDIITIDSGCTLETAEDHPMGLWRLYRVVSSLGETFFAAMDSRNPFANEVEAWSDGIC